MNQIKLFKAKIKNIHTVLMQAHSNTKAFTTPVQGDEREVVIRELLGLVLPQNYRLGKGAIIDAFGNETGQVDAVFEKPFSLSFPISSPTNVSIWPIVLQQPLRSNQTFIHRQNKQSKKQKR